MSSSAFQFGPAAGRDLLGGDLLAQCLHKLGAEVAFGVHGGHLDSFLMAAAGVGMELIDTRHETVAVQAAEGYAKVKGRVGVAFVTANSGFSNGLPGLATAFADRSPILVITSSPPLRDAETNTLQGFHDQVVIAKNITKLAHRVTNVSEIPRLTSLAWRTTTAGAPGPVLVDFPIDVLFTPLGQEVVAWGSVLAPPVNLPGPDPDSVEKTITLWQEAKRPAIIVSTGAAGAVEGIMELAQATRTPVFSSPKFSTSIPYNHPLRAGSATKLAVLAAMEQAPDFLIILGARTGFLLGGRSGAIIPNAGCKIIQVDLDGSEIGRSHHIDIGIVSDTKLAAKAMRLEVRERPFTAPQVWLDTALSLKSTPSKQNESEPVIIAQNDRLHPYHAVKKVFQCLPPGCTVCIDGGEAGGWALQNLDQARADLSIVTTGYLGFLGNGFGYSLGAAVADRSKVILNLQGDGSAGFHIAELDTYAKFGLKIITLVVNNKVWGMSQAGQDIIYGRVTDKRPCTAMNPRTRYDIVAEGFGCLGQRVDARDLKEQGNAEVETVAQRSLTAIGEAVQKLLDNGGPGLLDLVVSDIPYHDTTKAMVGWTDDPDVIVVPYYDNLPKTRYNRRRDQAEQGEI